MFQSRCMCETGFNTTIRNCRPQKGARHAASLRAESPVLPFERTAKLPPRARSLSAVELEL